jgi:hypothetical protein
MSTTTPAQLVTDRWFTFPLPPAAVRAALADPDRYCEWWPWLVEFAADGLHAGARWRCAVRSPLRTTLRFRLLIDVASERSITARLVGDVAGDARISLEAAATGDGTAVRLEASIRPSGTALAVLTRALPPVARWAHDQIVTIAAGQFADALRHRSEAWTARFDPMRPDAIALVAGSPPSRPAGV